MENACIQSTFDKGSFGCEVVLLSVDGGEDGVFLSDNNRCKGTEIVGVRSGIRVACDDGIRQSLPFHLITSGGVLGRKVHQYDTCRTGMAVDVRDGCSILRLGIIAVTVARGKCITEHRACLGIARSLIHHPKSRIGILGS